MTLISPCDTLRTLNLQPCEEISDGNSAPYRSIAFRKICLCSTSLLEFNEGHC